MKKYLLGLFAIALAVGFSAFTTVKQSPSKNTTNYYWFAVEPGYGSLSDFTNSEATFLGYSEAAPDNSCSNTSDKKCVVRFDEENLTNIVPGVSAEIDDQDGAKPSIATGRFRDTN